MGRYLFLIILLYSAVLGVHAQDSLRRCGTVERLEEKFNRNPSLKPRFEQQRRQFNNLERGRPADYKIPFTNRQRWISIGIRSFIVITAIIMIAYNLGQAYSIW